MPYPDATPIWSADALPRQLLAALFSLARLFVLQLVLPRLAVAMLPCVFGFLSDNGLLTLCIPLVVPDQPGMHGCLHTLEVVLCAFRGVAIFVPRSTCQNLSLVTLRTVPTAAQSLFCFKCCVVRIGCCAHMVGPAALQCWLFEHVLNAACPRTGQQATHYMLHARAALLITT